MFDCLHENFINIMGLINNRLPPDSNENLWVQTLRTMLNKKSFPKRKNLMFNLIHKNNIVLVERIRKLCRGRFTTKQLSKQKNISEEELIKTEKCDINFFFSPLAQTLLILCEEIICDENLTMLKVREDLINCLEGFSAAIKLTQESDLHEMYKIGGTALDLNESDEPLEIIDPPYLPVLTEAHQKKTYTLVLDLDETLVHYFEIGTRGKFLIRPGVDSFLAEMEKYFEIVIFTAAIQEYADWAISQITQNKSIKYRLYRQHTIPCGSVYIKDLSRLGRDLKRVIIVDNVPENFQLQQENGIFITSWFDDVTDTALSELSMILSDIGRQKTNDLREALREYRSMLNKSESVEVLSMSGEIH